VLCLTPEGRDWLGAHPEQPKPTPAGPELDRGPKHRPGLSRSDADLRAADDGSLFEQLRAWRWEKAKELHYAPYVIFHDAVLQRIAAERPGSLDELAAIRGIGPRKLEQFGADVLAILREHLHS
jgi:ATP-dependent DNA helicase RecQ